VRMESYPKFHNENGVPIVSVKHAEQACTALMVSAFVPPLSVKRFGAQLECESLTALASGNAKSRRADLILRLGTS
jgi:hypothetical protein